MLMDVFVYEIGKTLLIMRLSGLQMFQQRLKEMRSR